MRKILVVLISFCFCGLVFGETIKLKSGRTIEGKIVERTDKYIKVDIGGVPLTYYYDNIESIDGKILVPVQEKTAETDNPTKEKYNLAVNYFLNKDYKNAHNIFSEILSEEPNPYKAIVYFNMGMCLQVAGVAEVEKGDEGLSQALFTQASIYYQKAQEITPYFPQLYSNASLVAYYQHQSASVVDEMAATGQKLADELGAFPPDINHSIYSYRSFEALLSIAVNYIAEGNYTEAVNTLKNVIAKMEMNPPKTDYLRYTAYNSLGLGLFNLGDIKGAINSIENSIKIAPLQPKLDISYANLGMLYFREGNYAKAKIAVDKALVINPNNQTALIYQGKLEDVLGK